MHNTEDFYQLTLFSSFFPYLIWQLSPGGKVHPPSHGTVHLIAELCTALPPKSALVRTEHLELLSASSDLRAMRSQEHHRVAPGKLELKAAATQTATAGTQIMLVRLN